jgi:hypothetical protein
MRVMVAIAVFIWCGVCTRFVGLLGEKFVHFLARAEDGAVPRRGGRRNCRGSPRPAPPRNGIERQRDGASLFPASNQRRNFPAAAPFPNPQFGKEGLKLGYQVTLTAMPQPT